MKYIVIGLILLVLGGGGVGLFLYNRAAKAASAPPQTTAKVERKVLRIAVPATGSVASNKDVDIRCRASGEVLELPFDISNEVEPGALVMRLDTQDQDRAYAQALAVLDADKARLEQAKLNLQVAQMNLITTRLKLEAAVASAEARAADAAAKAKRTGELFEKKLASKEEYETALTTAALGDAQLKTAKTDLQELEQQKVQVNVREQDIKLIQSQLIQDQAKADTAKLAVDYCKVYAPPLKSDDPDAKWTVAKRPIQIGQIVQSAISNVSGGASVMTLSDLTHIYVLATVDESDVGSVEVGQKVTMKADAFRERENFTGKVVRIATMGVNQSNVVTFEVKIEVTSKNKKKLKPMMTTNVEIIQSEKEDVLVIPMAAAAKQQSDREDGEKRPPATASAGETRPATVDVLKADGTTETREVVLGLNDEVNYEVVSGLDEGETVVIKRASASSRFANARPPRGH